MTRVLVTGGVGFIGHHLISSILKTTDWEIVTLDRLDISGNLNRLVDLNGWEHNKKRIHYVYHDLKSPLNEFVCGIIGDVDYVFHLAASTHVDRSITDPVSFAMDNVIGTTNLLNWARTQKNLKLFFNFNTDEVFGPAPVGYASKEDDSFHPSNPYSSSKVGQWAQGYAFFVTYGLPVITTFTMNNFGERQHPEKLVPKCIRSVVNQTSMPIFAELDDGKLKSVGSRYWLHCQATAEAILFLCKHGNAGEDYNIIGFDELTNMEICEKIASIVGKPLIPELVDFHHSRPGHDRRYALDGSKMRDMGFKPSMTMDESLERTVRWTLDNPRWL